MVIAESLQFIGILAFAISGALVGVRRNLDLLGVLVVGGATGTGGGILRDLLIGVNPPVSLTYWPNITVALAGSLLVFFFHPRISRSRHFEVVFDAFGLGLFSATATVGALGQGLRIETSIVVGVLTAIGGGVVRDVLVNTVPGVLTRELYAVSALAGATVTAGVAVGLGALARAVGGGSGGSGGAEGAGAGAGGAALSDGAGAAGAGSGGVGAGGAGADGVVGWLVQIAESPELLGVVASLIGGTVAVGLRLLSYWRGWHLPRPRPAEAVPGEPPFVAAAGDVGAAADAANAADVTGAAGAGDTPGAGGAEDGGRASRGRGRGGSAPDRDR